MFRRFATIVRTWPRPYRFVNVEPLLTHQRSIRTLDEGTSQRRKARPAPAIVCRDEHSDILAFLFIPMHVDLKLISLAVCANYFFVVIMRTTKSEKARVHSRRSSASINNSAMLLFIG